MNRWSRLIIIFIAYGLALLHTAVPHHHNAVSNNEPLISPADCVFQGSIGKLLQMVFATDLGVGHLEAFKKGGDSDVAPSVLALPFICTSTFPVYVSLVCQDYSEASVIYREKLHSRLLLFSSGHLRAPPVFA